MNNELKFRILQLCSNHYLTAKGSHPQALPLQGRERMTAEIPDNWYDLTEE